MQKYQELRMVMPKTLPGQGRSFDWAGCSRWKALGLGRPHVLLATNLLGTLCRYFSCSPGSPPTFTKPPQRHNDKVQLIAILAFRQPEG